MAVPVRQDLRKEACLRWCHAVLLIGHVRFVACTARFVNVQLAVDGLKAEAHSGAGKVHSSRCFVVVLGCCQAAACIVTYSATGTQQRHDRAADGGRSSSPATHLSRTAGSGHLIALKVLVTAPPSHKTCHPCPRLLVTLHFLHNIHTRTAASLLLLAGCMPCMLLMPLPVVQVHHSRCYENKAVRHEQSVKQPWQVDRCWHKQLKGMQ